MFNYSRASTLGILLMLSLFLLSAAAREPDAPGEAVLKFSPEAPYGDYSEYARMVRGDTTWWYYEDLTALEAWYLSSFALSTATTDKISIMRDSEVASWSVIVREIELKEMYFGARKRKPEAADIDSSGVSEIVPDKKK